MSNKIYFTVSQRFWVLCVLRLQRQVCASFKWRYWRRCDLSISSLYSVFHFVLISFWEIPKTKQYACWRTYLCSASHYKSELNPFKNAFSTYQKRFGSFLNSNFSDYTSYRKSIPLLIFYGGTFFISSSVISSKLLFENWDLYCNS